MDGWMDWMAEAVPRRTRSWGCGGWMGVADGWMGLMGLMGWMG